MAHEFDYTRTIITAVIGGSAAVVVFVLKDYIKILRKGATTEPPCPNIGKCPHHDSLETKIDNVAKNQNAMREDIGFIKGKISALTHWGK